MNMDKDSIQLINTAIIKSKENRLQSSYEERLGEVCSRPAMKALSMAISELSEEENLSRDQAAVQLIETVKELEKIWDDYVMMEGISNLKSILKSSNKPN